MHSSETELVVPPRPNAKTIGTAGTHLYLATFSTIHINRSLESWAARMRIQECRSGWNSACPEDSEIPETAEFLFIGPPTGSPQRSVLHLAALILLAAIVLGTWLLPGSSKNEAGPLAPISAAAGPQQALPGPGQASAREYANPVDPLTAYAQFCQNNTIQCVSTPPPDIGYIQFCQNGPTLCAVKPD